MQAPTPGLARGLDCSVYQGGIDWPSVKAAGIAFGVARASQGGTYRDPTFPRNWPGMKASGILRSAYHFAMPGETSPNLADDAARQAQAFVAAIRDAGGYDRDLPPVLDLEENPHRLPAAALRDWAEVFCSTVDHLLGLEGPRATMLYSGEAFLRAMAVPPNHALARRGLWLAWPSSAPVPDIPPWTRWTALQVSWRGRIPGIGGVVDTDVWSLTPAALAALYGGAPAAPAGPRLMLWQHPVLEAVTEALARQYGWKATGDMSQVAQASAVLCVGGAPDWIARAKAVTRGTWHAPLAGQDLWHTLEMIAQAGMTGRF